MNFLPRARKVQGRIAWSLPMRVVCLFMSFYLFVLPQVLTAQSVVAIFQDRGSQPPPIIEEEVLKHAVDLHDHVPMPIPERALDAQFHQYEEAMLDHPLMEVPHQPPRS